MTINKVSVQGLFEVKRSLARFRHREALAKVVIRYWSENPTDLINPKILKKIGEKVAECIKSTA